MDNLIKDISWENIVAVIGAVGGIEGIKWILLRKSNQRVAAAQAFEAEYKVLIDGAQRFQKELDDAKKEIKKLNEKVNELYSKLRNEQEERLKLLKEKNEIEVALKEAEKHVCYQPDDRCIQRLNPNDKCLFRGLLRGGYAKDHPDAIILEEDMKRQSTDKSKEEEEAT